MGLWLNAKKTEVMTFNTEHVKLKTLEGSALALTEDFKYLGSYIGSTENNIGMVSTAFLDESLGVVHESRAKKILFLATVEAILIYGCEAWTLTTKEQNSLDGCYTRMLRMAMNMSWIEKVRNGVLYGNLPRVTDKIRERRLRLAGHCVRHSELEVSDLVLWEPTQGKSSRGSQRLTYVDMLRKGHQTRIHSGDKITDAGQAQMANHGPKKLDMTMLGI